MPRDGAVHVIVNSMKPVGKKQADVKIPVVMQGVVKVVLPIQDLWSCSPSGTRRERAVVRNGRGRYDTDERKGAKRRCVVQYLRVSHCFVEKRLSTKCMGHT